MSRPLPKAFDDLRAFVAFLEERKQLVRVTTPVNPRLEMTEICTRLLAEKGPAVLFTNVAGHDMPVLANLFGTEERVGLAMGRQVEELDALGAVLADLRQPAPPQNFEQAVKLGKGLLHRIYQMHPKTVRNPPCQQVVLTGDQIDLTRLPIMTCWPEDAAPLITWPLVITQGPKGGPVNVGVYRMQVLGPRRLTMRWLAHRGGAQHAREFGDLMPVAVAIGADPATILAAVTPIPETLSEYAFAGLLREQPVELAPAIGVPLMVPARAEIVLEGYVNLRELDFEGPFGDHTGYYNEVELFPVFNVERVTMRKNPLYLSTFTGRPPDEPSVLALALNRVFVPLLRKQFPEIHDFHLPAEACSYRLAVVSLRKRYPGHAFRVMAGVWGFLRQFLYTKYIVVVDEEIDVRDWEAVAAAINRHVHAGRDIQILTNTPIDYLDFASPQAGLGSKMGIDATTKIGVEREVVTRRPLGEVGLAHDWPSAVRRAIPAIRALRHFPDSGQSVLQINKNSPSEARRVVEALWRIVPPGAGADQVWVVDPDIRPGSWDDLLWAMATRTDPARDVILDAVGGRFAIDATNKFPEETERRWGRVLRMDDGVVRQVSEQWPDYRLPGSGKPIWRDPA